MEKSVRDEMWQYDLFISYARFDDDLHGFVQELAPRLNAIFRELTGLDPRIFVDATEITSAMMWEKRIQSALTDSAALIVIETPSYYTSDWCQHELDSFLVMETQRRNDYQLLPYESLIFPILRTPIDIGLEDNVDQQRRKGEVAARQATNLIGIQPDDPQYEVRITRLIGDIVSVIRKLMQPDFKSIDARPTGPRTRSGLALTTPLVTTYSGSDDRKLLQLLSDAQAVIVVGISNEDITEILEAAIEEKRRKARDLTAFWDHLHIVFLADELLTYIDDGLSTEFPTRSMALAERARMVSLSRRRLMSQLLRNGISDRWTLYTYPYALPFAGILFVMPDGKRVVQLKMMRPSRREKDHLRIEFIDRVDQFFESAFGEVVKASTEEHEIVLVGTPEPDFQSFVCRGSRFRRSVLVEGRSISDWIAAIVAVTWRPGRYGPEPLLQVNTPRNSTREMGKASHISGYINARDHDRVAGGQQEPGPEDFVLPLPTAVNAVRRELLNDFGIRESESSPVFLEAQPFYYPDKENLFFYIFSQRIDPTYQFASDVQMFAWSLDELLMVRRHHVLTNAKLALTSDLTQRQRIKARELVVENLIAQGDSDLADQVGALIATGDLSSDIEVRIEAVLQESKVCKYAFGRELEVQGLAGLQYRIFYSTLLPAYASLDIPRAKEYRAELSNNHRRSEAVKAVQSMYSDEDFMTALPIEL